MRTRGTILFFLLSVSISHASEHSVIGEDTSIEVKADGSNVDAPFRASLDAYGMMVLDKKGTCTVTHLGNGYAITAGHCLSYDSHIVGTLADHPVDCSGVSVRWGFRKGHPSVSSHCTEVVFAEYSSRRDFALFKVDHSPKVKISISNENHLVEEKTKISIFGHPKHRPLSWTQYCAVKEPPSIRDKEAGLFLHQCDTKPGDSGAAVLSVNKAGMVKIVGIHNGEYIDPKKKAASQASEFNHATDLYEVHKELAERGLKLEKVVN